MKRRNFIKIAGAGATIPILFNGMNRVAKASPFENSNGLQSSDRILVLINLAGGNDGLNTLIPLDQYETLRKVRPDVIHPQSSILNISDGLGLHSSLTGFKELFEQEKLCAVQNVGYPLQNQSHFRSADIWTSGSTSTVYEGSGWLGRFLALRHPDFPSSYPNSQFTDPLSITMGSVTSNTCQGQIYDMGMAVAEIDDGSNILIGGTDTPPDTYAGEEILFINTLMSQTNEYFAVINQALESGNNLSEKYPEDGENQLANKLKTVANLISGGLNTQVYVINHGGFDTHANQVNIDGLTGAHADLLDELSVAVAAFQDDIEKLGVADRVLGMTFSEFGRRIVSNASLGTDHGSAAPLFLFGTSVNPTVLGNNPVIDPDVEVFHNLEWEFDFKSIYWSVLRDWFSLSESELETLLFGTFDYLPVLKQGIGSASELDIAKDLRIENIYPNPIRDYSRLNFYSSESWLKASVLDLQGREMKVLADKHFSANYHTMNFYLGDLPQAHYILKLQNSSGVVTQNIVLVK